MVGAIAAGLAVAANAADAPGTSAAAFQDDSLVQLGLLLLLPGALEGGHRQRRTISLLESKLVAGGSRPQLRPLLQHQRLAPQGTDAWSKLQVEGNCLAWAAVGKLLCWPEANLLRLPAAWLQQREAVRDSKVRGALAAEAERLKAAQPDLPDRDVLDTLRNHLVRRFIARNPCLRWRNTLSSLSLQPLGLKKQGER